MSEGFQLAKGTVRKDVINTCIVCGKKTDSQKSSSLHGTEQGRNDM